VAERIRTAIEGGKFEVKNKDAKLSVSIGVTEFHKGQDLEKFLSSAQQALQKAKDAGRNRVVVKK
jgi:diguanylate cyclase (GGDEF)-like protein